MSTSMILQIPVATISPNLDEIQNIFSQVLQNILDVNKFIPLWGQKEVKSAMKGGKYITVFSASVLFLTEKWSLIFLEYSTEQPKNYYKAVSENKEIVRVYMSLQGVMYLLSPDVTSLLEVSVLNYSVNFTKKKLI